MGHSTAQCIFTNMFHWVIPATLCKAVLLPFYRWESWGLNSLDSGLWFFVWMVLQLILVTRSNDFSIFAVKLLNENLKQYDRVRSLGLGQFLIFLSCFPYLSNGDKTFYLSRIVGIKWNNVIKVPKNRQSKNISFDSLWYLKIQIKIFFLNEGFT